MKILLVGSSGQLGQEIIDLSKQLKLNLHDYNRKQLNIANFEQVRCKIIEIKPTYIINAAAYTLVDKAEIEPDLAFAANAKGVENLAVVADELDIPLLHISTDYIFNGEKKIAYLEEDKPNPLSVYGHSKLAGEILLKKSCSKYIILRVSWVFSNYGNNFVKSIIKLAKERYVLQIVADQRGAPTYAGDIAKTLFQIINYLDKGCKAWGIYHYVGTPNSNWYEFAKEIVYEAKKKHKLILEEIRPITALEYSTLATRPYNSELDCKKIEHIFNIKLNNWHHGLRKVVDNYGV